MPQPDADPHLIRRRSGIFTPTAPHSERTQKAMARKKFQKILRYVVFARDLGLLTKFICLNCKTPVNIHRAEHLVRIDTRAGSSINPNTENFELSCACTVWTVKQ